MGSDESHFNVSVGSDGQSYNWDSVHKPQPFWRERRAEAVSNRGPSAYQPNALPLGQTGAQAVSMAMDLYILDIGPCLLPPSFQNGCVVPLELDFIADDPTPRFSFSITAQVSLCRLSYITSYRTGPCPARRVTCGYIQLCGWWWWWWWWLRLYRAILRSRADSLRSHVILHEWLALCSVFLNIHGRYTDW